MILKNIKFPSSGYKSPWLSYWMVVVLVAFIIFLSFIKGLGWIPSDSPSYYSAGELIFTGVVDDIRTPVYPIILHLLKLVFGYDGSRIAVSIFQTIVFIISIIYINKTVRLITPQYLRLNFWITILYILLLCGCKTWIEFVMTDSLAISCSVFLTYCIVRAAHPKALSQYAIWIFVWLLLLIFNRPVLMCYIPVVLFFWIMLYLNRRVVLRKFLIGIGSIVVIVILIGVYCREVNKQYNIHSITFVGSVNKYAMLRYEGIITHDDTDDLEFRSFLEERLTIREKDLTVSEQREEMIDLLDSPRSMHPRIEKAVNHAISSNPQSYIKAILKWLKYSPGVLYINVLIIFAGGVLVVYSYNYRKFPLVPWVLFLLGSSLLVAIYIGANADWRRLSAPMTPMLSLLVGWAFSKLRLLPPDAE